MNYKQWLEALKYQAEGKEWFLDFSGLEARLQENLTARDRYGGTPALKSERRLEVDDR